MAHRVAPEAEADLDEIWHYLATESGSFDVSDRCIDSLTQRFLLLASSPYIGRPRDEDLRPDLLSFTVGAYIIIYRIHSEDTEEVIDSSRRTRQPRYPIVVRALRPFTYRANALQLRESDCRACSAISTSPCSVV